MSLNDQSLMWLSDGAVFFFTMPTYWCGIQNWIDNLRIKSLKVEERRDLGVISLSLELDFGFHSFSLSHSWRFSPLVAKYLDVEFSFTLSYFLNTGNLLYA